MGDLEVLLTNDDGVDSAGIQRLYHELSTLGSVTMVAPAEDQSAVGRAISRSVTVTEHDLGYVIDGTPTDCVVAGLTSLCPETDIVVAGCNQGANLGSAVLGRSGTVSAAVEAAFFDIPAIATSMYIPSPDFEKGKVELAPEQYDVAIDATRYLVDNAFEDGFFDHADYLNINAPVTEECTGEMAITRPSQVYRMDTRANGDTLVLENDIWELMATGEIPDPDDSDRRAVIEGHVSVSPLTAPHTVENSDGLHRLAADFSRR